MHRTLACFVTATIGLLGAMPPAAADGCRKEEEFDARPFMARAQSAEQAGRFEQAYKETNRIHQEMCAVGVDYKQVDALRLRVAVKQAELDEKQARYRQSADWFRIAGRHDDLDRVMMKYAKAAPTDTGVFSTAFSHFDRGRQGGPSEPHLKELRAIASANGDRELANEDKLFTPLRDTTEELGRARHWLRYVDGGERKVAERATRRGDTLAKEDAPGPFERALKYYQFADNTQKEKQLKERAARLGEQHAAKGENTVAVRFFHIAGQDDKAQQLEKRSEAQQQKTEAKRKQKFDQDQKALEKELGL